MKEVELISREVERIRAEGKSAVLATVVNIEGSSYRLPGARMLIADTVWTAGSVSGGCLEGDVVLRAREVLQNQRPLVVTYDTTSDDDIVFGVGLGCRGIIRVLLEPVTPEPAQPDLIDFIRHCLERRERGVVATVTAASGASGAHLGARLVRYANGEIRTNISDGELKSFVEDHVGTVHASGQFCSLGFDLRAGHVEVFIEAIRPPAPLVVFGAGHDAIPVVRLARELGWHVTVVDHRPAYATAERFPLANEIVLWSSDELPARVRLGPDTLALVMTHNYLRDLRLLKALLPSPVRYLGLLGPRKRAEQLLEELEPHALPVSPDQRRRFYAPVGLDIGAEGPEAVALAVIAEMQAVIAGREPRHLRARKGSIHGLEQQSRPLPEAHQA